MRWLRDFLREELSPYAGRGAQVARMVVAASLAMVINMTFKIPFGAFAALYALILSREHPLSTLQAAKTIVVWFSFSAAYVVVGAIVFSGEPVLRITWVLGSLFLIFFAMKAMTNYTAAARFGYLLVITIPVWDEHISAQQKVDLTLWAVAGISFATGITVVIEFIYARLNPVDVVSAALVERLQAIAWLLRLRSKGTESVDTERNIARLTILGTSHMRQDLLRSSYSPETTQQMGSVIALVGRLVDLAAILPHFSAEISDVKPERLDLLAERIEAASQCVLGGNMESPPAAPYGADTVTMVPILVEMERTALLLLEVLGGSEVVTGYHPAPQQERHSRPFFVPDAFTNPEHVKFAIRGALAASLCYLTYNLIGWSGISTSVTTCFVTALSTIGASRQKQILRFGGAIVGGVILGFGAQALVLPAIDSIAGFLVVFVAVSTLAAWIATSGPRLSYFGVQIAVAFYLINLAEFKFQTSLSVARDRVVGILLGLIAMWVVFDQLWGASAAVEMERRFVAVLRLMAKLMRAPVSAESGVAIAETYSLREMIGTSFEAVRQNADGVILEFGRTRERGIALRNHVLDWQLRMREICTLRVTLLKYRLRLPGFDLPDPVRRAQMEFDAQTAQRFEALGDLVSGKIAPGQAKKSTPPDQGLQMLNRVLREEETVAAAPALLTFTALVSRFDSALASLERDMQLQSKAAMP